MGFWSLLHVFVFTAHVLVCTRFYVLSVLMTNWLVIWLFLRGGGKEVVESGFTQTNESIVESASRGALMYPCAILTCSGPCIYIELSLGLPFSIKPPDIFPSSSSHLTFPTHSHTCSQFPLESSLYLYQPNLLLFGRSSCFCFSPFMSCMLWMPIHACFQLLIVSCCLLNVHCLFSSPCKHDN